MDICANEKVKFFDSENTPDLFWNSRKNQFKSRSKYQFFLFFYDELESAVFFSFILKVSYIDKNSELSAGFVKI